jgi:RNA polymerase sigma factor (sigma-70 family)
MRNDDPSLDELARRAAQGDREALSTLVRDLQHPMYRLALRFLGHPDDAQDACQEILVRIATRLGTFEGRSKFTTWAYTVAVRSLLRTRKRLACHCGRQIASSEAAGILDRDRLPLARHAREEVRVWVEPVAKQLDAVVAIGDLYRFDRFAAPTRLWEELQARFPDLLTSA